MRLLHLLVFLGTFVAPFSLALGADDWPAQIQRWFGKQTWERDTAGPIISLGEAGQFDDMHTFAPAVIEEDGRYLLWYSGSRGTPGNRVFRLGLATSSDGKAFEKYRQNPVLEFADGRHSVLTPAPLRDANGKVLRENGRLRMWFSSATLGKGGPHTLHQSWSDDGIAWTSPSESLYENVYCPTVLKIDDTYHMWFSDVSRRPWVIRHATSSDGARWIVSARPSIALSQQWEAEVLTYPTVLKADGVFLMWYGSYDRAVRRETTAIGFAASLDGEHWFKHPDNPVLRPDASRAWESNYVGSGSVLRLSDGSFRYWYASRKQPPFNNLYFAINTARWAGPNDKTSSAVLPLPPKKGDRGRLVTDAAHGRSLTALEVIDGNTAILRAWFLRPAEGSDRQPPNDVSFVDLWITGISTAGMQPESPVKLSETFDVTGDELIDTTCGKRSFPRLAATND
jgi:predicted GH43/DUF377 family glycosyl hydrolase